MRICTPTHFPAWEYLSPMYGRKYRKYSLHIPFWKTAPFTRVFIALAAGILVGEMFFPARPAHLFPAIFIIITLWLVPLIFPAKRSLAAGLTRLFAIGVTGWILVFITSPANRHDFIGRHYKPGQAIVATLLEPGQPKTKTWKADARVALELPDGRRVPVSGKVILYLQRDSLPIPPHFGSVIRFSKNMQEIRNAGNPGGFDYKTFTWRKGIFYQVFLREGDWQYTGEQSGSRFREMVLSLQDYCLRTIRRYIKPESQVAIAQALIIGYKADLDKTMVEQFAATGTAHIIAISGMHLGMIYVMLLFVLRPLGKTRNGRFARVAITLGIIWVFTFLTGAAPSITRASIMFSILATGQLWNRKGNTINLLALAGIILLLIDPQSLFDAGFQLSFAAVLSIAIFYLPLRNKWQPKNKMLKGIWEMIAITLTAQIFTTPIVIYLFHQFPTYFLLSNLLAVPVSTLCVYLLVALLAFGWTGFIAKPIGLFTGFCLELFTWSIQWVAALPNATIGHIQVSLLQAILLVAAISMAGFWLLRKNTAALWGAIGCMMLVAGLRAHQSWQSHQQEKIIIFNAPGNRPAIDWVHGKSAIFIGDPEFQQENHLRNFHLLPTRIYYQYDALRTQEIEEDGNANFKTGRLNFFIAQQNINTAAPKPKTDILLVGRNNRNKPAVLLDYTSPGQIVLLNGARPYQIAEWRNAADSLNLPLHCIGEDGAFTIGN